MLSVFSHAWEGYQKKGWSLEFAICYIAKRIAKTLHLFYPSVSAYMVKRAMKSWIVKGKDGSRYFDFKGAKIPYIEPRKNYRIYEDMPFIFPDIFAIHCLHNDHYTKEIVAKIDAVAMDGPYGYTDGPFDVTVKAGDVVLDAGAWIGDFSAYAAAKKAVCYAFEPMAETYGLLQATAAMNNTEQEIYIVPVNKGLSDNVGLAMLNTGDSGSGADARLGEWTVGTEENGIAVTTIDAFVKENNLQRVDFIKADIEGAERDMLRGARETLKRFAPKLAICTYHLPDDPQVLEQIIKEANPDYTVVHLTHKLMAMVVK